MHPTYLKIRAVDRVRTADASWASNAVLRLIADLLRLESVRPERDVGLEPCSAVRSAEHQAGPSVHLQTSEFSPALVQRAKSFIRDNGYLANTPPHACRTQ